MLDLHAVTYTAANLMELEVIRLADWLLDLPLPGERRVLEGTVKTIRTTYNRAGGGHRLSQRIGEFVDALQLRELSLGDAAATYTVATGGTVSPGSGTVVRFNKLIDWAQHVLGDLNQLGGACVGRRRGLIQWGLPGRVVDGAQAIISGTFHYANVTVAKVLDRGITAVEMPAEGIINVGRRPAHRYTTVFVRMPTSVYRAHELWVLRHRLRIYVGTREELASVSHADLFHPRVGSRRLRWWTDDRWRVEPVSVMLVMDRRTFMSAPRAFRPYVVPAVWVFDPDWKD